MEKQNDFKPYIPAERITPELTVTSIIMGVLLADMMYAVVDPRVKLS